MEQAPQRTLAADREDPLSSINSGKIRNKGTPTLLNLKGADNLLDREDKRASRTLSILFSIENPSGAPSGNCPIVMVVKYKGSSMCESNAPVEGCKEKRNYHS